MPRPSSITRLPREVRQRLRALYEQGLTLDELHAAACAALAEIDGDWRPPSRSAIHRDRQRWEETARRLREAREMAEAISVEIKDLPGDQTGQAIVDLIRALTMRVLQRELDGETPDMSPKDLMMLARTALAAARAAQTDARTRREIAAQAREEAARAVEAEAKKRGFDAQTVRAFFDIAAGRAG